MEFQLSKLHFDEALVVFIDVIVSVDEKNYEHFFRSSLVFDHDCC